MDMRSGMNSPKNMINCVLIFSGVLAVINFTSFIATWDYFHLVFGIFNVIIFAYFFIKYQKMKKGGETPFVKRIIVDQHGNEIKDLPKDFPIPNQMKQKVSVEKDVLKKKFKDFQKNNK